MIDKFSQLFGFVISLGNYSVLFIYVVINIGLAFILFKRIKTETVVINKRKKNIKFSLQKFNMNIFFQGLKTFICFNLLVIMFLIIIYSLLAINYIICYDLSVKLNIHFAVPNFDFFFNYIEIIRTALPRSIINYIIREIIIIYVIIFFCFIYYVDNKEIILNCDTLKQYAIKNFNKNLFIGMHIYSYIFIKLILYSTVILERAARPLSSFSQQVHISLAIYALTVSFIMLYVLIQNTWYTYHIGFFRIIVANARQNFPTLDFFLKNVLFLNVSMLAEILVVKNLNRRPLSCTPLYYICFSFGVFLRKQFSQKFQLRVLNNFGNTFEVLQIYLIIFLTLPPLLVSSIILVELVFFFKVILAYKLFPILFLSLMARVILNFYITFFYAINTLIQKKYKLAVVIMDLQAERNIYTATKIKKVILKSALSYAHINFIEKNLSFSEKRFIYINLFESILAYQLFYNIKIKITYSIKAKILRLWYAICFFLFWLVVLIIKLQIFFI